jgi:mannose-1-phosphate guanylyltransferase / phosphomannomutase
MKAIIMAGGEGTRLRPLTSLRPKPMVPIVNQPVMEHIVGLVKHHGIDKVVATLAFMPSFIQDYFGDGEEWGVEIKYAIEDTPLGTAGSVKNAEPLLDTDEPFVVISGDAITDIDLTEVINFHKERGAAVTIALKRVPDPLDFGVVITAEDGKIERFLEKPTWGQVFSDTINTGIYVVEPWVLGYIPAEESYDFSGDLFPKLMADGHPLYGIAVEGYWCDVGSRESYLEVHRDILEGKSHTFIPGVQAREGLWVSESAKIDKTATLGKGVVVGENVTIGANVVIGDNVVIDNNCVVSESAHVSHSILWGDTYVGRQAEVSGAVLCRHVDIREGAVVGVGAVIGDESVVGQGARVGADVRIFPYKRIESQATVNSSLIWESTGPRSLFGDAGVQGLVGVDITPELALKVAEAYGTLLPKGGHVVLTRDSTRAARMVKRAMIAGLNAAGVNARDLRVASPAVSRFTTQKTRCVGGIHISGSMREPQSLEIRFFDANGLDIAPWEQKKIERMYFRQEFRRAFFDEIGDIIYPPRPLEYYGAALKEAMIDAGLVGEWRKVVADMVGGPATFMLPQVAHSWHVNLIALNGVVDSEAASAPSEEPEEAAIEELARATKLFGADLGVMFDWGAERIRMLTSSGRLLDPDTALHAMIDLWCRTRDREGSIAVPLSASRVVEEIAERHGRSVVRPGRSRRALAQSVLDGRAVFAGSESGGFIFGDFFPAYDGVLSTGMAVRMLSKLDTTLDEVVDDLPDFHKVHMSVRCSAERKGAVMRAVTERAADMKTDLTEGVRAEYSDGWILVLPHSSEPIVQIWAEAGSESAARGRAQQWQRFVLDAIADSDSAPRVPAEVISR